MALFFTSYIERAAPIGGETTLAEPASSAQVKALREEIADLQKQLDVARRETEEVGFRLSALAVARTTMSLFVAFRPATCYHRHTA